MTSSSWLAMGKSRPFEKGRLFFLPPQLAAFASHVGTFGTCRAGLLMSVDRDRPEVAGGGSKRRDCPMADIMPDRVGVDWLSLFVDGRIGKC
jgi:hypothetical protein